MDLVLTALANKLAQLPDEKFYYQIKKDPMDNILRMQELSSEFKRCVINAQLEEGRIIPLRVCVENLKADEITEEQRGKIFRNINKRLFCLLNRRIDEEAPHEWEMIRKIFFIFLDRSSQIASHFATDQHFEDYNPFVSLRHATHIIDLLRIDRSEDLMEIIGVFAQFVGDRKRLKDVPAYFRSFEITNIIPHLFVRINKQPSRMQEFAYKFVDALD